MNVLGVQQPLGVLDVDAAELGEHSHDLQEQETAGQSGEGLGVWPALPPPTNTGAPLKLITFEGFHLRFSSHLTGQPRDKAWLNSLSFPFSLQMRGQNSLGPAGVHPPFPLAPPPLGLSPCTQGRLWENQALQAPRE